MAFDLFQPPPGDRGTDSGAAPSLDNLAVPPPRLPSSRKPTLEDMAAPPPRMPSSRRPTREESALSSPSRARPQESAPTQTPAAPAAPQQQGRPEEFWNWMRQNHPRVRNPNPLGRARDIATNTLKSYAEGSGQYSQQAAQIVEQYYRQYQQAQDREQAQAQRRRTEIPEGFEIAKDLSEFKPGDIFFEEGFRGGEPLRVREANRDRIIAEGGIHYYPSEVDRTAEGYLRKPAPEPSKETPATPRDPSELSYGPVQKPDQVATGDVLKLKRPRYNDREFLVRQVGDRLVATAYRYGEFSNPSPVDESFFQGAEIIRVRPEEVSDRLRNRINRGDITAVAGERVRSPYHTDRGMFLREGDKAYRVLERRPGHLEVQHFDEQNKRAYGRPLKISKEDLENDEYTAADYDISRRRKPSGKRIKNLSKIKEGKVYRLLFDKKPTYARVESVDEDKAVFQRLNSRTGRTVGDPEEITSQELSSWAHVRKVDNMPRAVTPPPPPMVGPDGKENPTFAEPGKGELAPNYQPSRYDDVDINTTPVARNKIRELFGDKLGDRDPVEFACDLAGCGGITKSLSNLNVSAYGSQITVSGDGPGISRMSRTIRFNENGQPESISNGYFKVKGRRRRGLGMRMLATQVAAAQKAGFKHIHVQAAGSRTDREYKGYYAWPALGYSAPWPSRHWNRLPEDVRKEILKVYPRKEGQPENEMPKGLDFVHVMSVQGGRDYWKERGSTVYMSFPLDKDSLSVKALTKYVREKAKANNVGADEFLQRAAHLIRMASLILAGKGKQNEDNDDGPLIEEAPRFTEEDEKILDKVWDEMNAFFQKQVRDGS